MALNTHIRSMAVVRPTRAHRTWYGGAVSSGGTPHTKSAQQNQGRIRGQRGEEQASPACHSAFTGNGWIRSAEAWIGKPLG